MDKNLIRGNEVSPAPVNMETEATDGSLASNAPSSPTEEHAQLLVDLSVTTPTRQHTHPPDSPSVPTIKEEEEGEEQGEKKGLGLEETGHSGEDGSTVEEPMLDSPNDQQDGESQTIASYERPFQCSQCGVSFTQKGNLLRHVKLHTGEKPFKCPFCSYACRRRDALTGHLRTHSARSRHAAELQGQDDEGSTPTAPVGKPHKCNYCGRSYKQRASLEEHKERCHSYLQRISLDSAPNSGPYQAEESPKEQQPLMDAVSIASFDRPPVIERLQGNVGKRKSTTPQKFVGEKLMRYGYPELSYDMVLKYEKEAEIMQAQMMEPSINSTISYMSTEPMRPLLHHPALTMINPLFPQNYALGPRDAPPPPPPPPELPASNGPISLVCPKNPPGRHGESPGTSRPGSVGSERSSPAERSGQPPNHGPRAGSSPAHRRKDIHGAEPSDQEGATDRASGFRVFSRDGRELQLFRCEHCRILFLDHVMYTIHMGCHGYRDPLECNICGHRSRDRYEFSSHIVRGEHTFK
ncbi:hypothetical protein JZ751_027818 [Albula glossodonta]|uniref:C2H2-type domain-containing protein n=1 Tax=Albula glossodonta TaxID=121402 RepID=A0A8T2PA08_9TELE|nr:hypothetical protein JZ751_027818 [Albula glossodonta]